LICTRFFYSTYDFVIVTYRIMNKRCNRSIFAALQQRLRA
jgi:hypothetical protein